MQEIIRNTVDISMDFKHGIGDMILNPCSILLVPIIETLKEVISYHHLQYECAANFQ